MRVNEDNLSVFIPVFLSTKVFVSLSVCPVCILSMYSLARLNPQTLYFLKKEKIDFLRRVSQTNTAGLDKSISAQSDEKGSKSLNCHRATPLEKPPEATLLLLHFVNANMVS